MYKPLSYLTKALSIISITDPLINSSGITQLALLTQRIVVVTCGTLIALPACVGWFAVTLARFRVTSYVTTNDTIPFTLTILTA